MFFHIYLEDKKGQHNLWKKKTENKHVEFFNEGLNKLL